MAGWGAALLGAGLLATAPAGAAPAAGPERAHETLGRSVEGRRLHAHLIGDRVAGRRVLVVGCVHGNERAGLAITKALLARGTPPRGTAWWVVHTVNPDRCRGGLATRGNARGVDLNRNSPWAWRPLRGIYASGSGPLSEPESRAVNRLVRRVRPDVSVWFHQHAALVDTIAAGDDRVERRYAAAVGLPPRDFGHRPGSITSWQEWRWPRAHAFVVELPAGAASGAAVRRHVRAIERL